LLVVLLLAGADARAETWLTYKSDAGRFRIDMPGRPTVAPQTTKGGHTQTVATVTSGLAAYMVSFVDSPVGSLGRKSAAQLLEGVAGAAAQGGMLLRDKPIALAGYPGREYVIARNSDTSVTVIRVTLVGNRLYQMAYSIGAETEPTSPDVLHFLNSFALTALAPWVPYGSADGRYRIDMPADPKVSSETLANGVLQTEVAVVELAARYAVTTADYPDASLDASMAAKRLADARDAAAAGHELVRDQPITLVGNPGREYTIARGDGTTIVTRSTLVGTRLYRVTYATRDQTEPPPPDMLRFFDSFALK
jgi:hypothetical protein